MIWVLYVGYKSYVKYVSVLFYELLKIAWNHLNFGKSLELKDFREYNGMENSVYIIAWNYSKNLLNLF